MTHNRFAVIGISLFVCFFVSSLLGSLPSFVICAVLALSAAVFGFAVKNKAVTFAVSAAAAAFLFYGVYSAIFIEPTALLRDRTAEVTATVISTGRPGGDTAYITAEGSADGVPVRFSFYTPDLGIKPGDTVTAEVTFTAVPAAASYSDSYNYSRGIFLRAYADNTEFTPAASSSPADIIAAYSAKMRLAVAQSLGGDESGLLLAVFFGDGSRLSDELSAQLRACGLSHFTAVSGMHVSLIVIVIMTVLGVTPWGRHRAVRFVTVLVLAAVFMLFFDMTASVRRSGIMLVFFCAAELFRRERTTLNSLGAALTLILLVEPYACRDAGLLLSACGTFGAGVVSPALCDLIGKRRRVTPAAAAVITCVCASYCTIPAAALIFGGFSLLSPITSPLILPFFTAALVFTLLFVLTGGAFGFLLVPAGAALSPVISAVRLFSGLKGAYIVPDAEFFPLFAVLAGLFIAVTVILTCRRGLGKRFIAYSAALAFCALIGTVTVGRIINRDTAKITVCSDGSDFLAAVEYRSGVSLFASGVSTKLSAEAYDILYERGIGSFDLICVLLPENRRDAYSRAFDALPATERHFTDNAEYECDVGGKYTVDIYEDALIAEINGVSVIFSDVSAAPVYGGQDVAVYGGCKRSENYAINGATVLAGKKYRDCENAYNAYYSAVEIRIAPDGTTRVKTR